MKSLAAKGCWANVIEVAKFAVATIHRHSWRSLEEVQLPLMNNVGPRRKRVKHFHQPGGDMHELTFSCYRRLPLLTNDSWRTELSNYINQAGEELGLPAKQQRENLPFIHGLRPDVFDRDERR